MILKIFLFWRFGLFLVTYLGSISFPLVANGGLGAVGPGKEFDFWASWAQWDGGHYYSIVQNGYTLNLDYAFFPLYPYLVRIVSKFFSIDILLSGLMISNICFLGFLLIFFKLLKEKYSEKIAYFVTITFLVFPTTFFTVAFYSESLFLLLVVGCFYFLAKEKYIFASVLAALASLTRLPGLFLVLAVFYSYFARLDFKFNKVDRKLLQIFPSLFGFLIYGLYLYATNNDFFKFLTVQSFWQRSVQDPISTILAYLGAVFTIQGRPLNDFLDLSITLLFLGILVWGIRKIPSSWWIFSILVILVGASTGTLTSMPRYVLVSIGAFVIIGKLLVKNSNIRILTWLMFLICQAVLAVLFVNGYWVA